MDSQSPSKRRLQIYLAHSVWEREKGREIEQKLKSLGYDVYNPFYPSNYKRNDIERLDKGVVVPWNITSKELSEKIVKRDFNGVNSCDILIAILPEIPTIGIPIEMYYAKERGKIVIAVTKKLASHPWVIWLSDIIVSTSKELLEYLADVNKVGGKMNPKPLDLEDISEEIIEELNKKQPHDVETEIEVMLDVVKKYLKSACEFWSEYHNVEGLKKLYANRLWLKGNIQLDKKEKEKLKEICMSLFDFEGDYAKLRTLEYEYNEWLFKLTFKDVLGEGIGNERR